MAASRATGASGDTQSPASASDVEPEDARPPQGDTARRDRLAKALRGKHDSTDARPSYRAADALLPVVEAALAAEQETVSRVMEETLTQWIARAQKAERERDEALQRLAELEGALNWQTSCLSCARLLDASYADHVRAEQAERERDDYRARFTNQMAAATDLIEKLRQAEAAIQRVRDLHHDEDGCCSACMDVAESSVASPCPTLAALDQPEENPCP